MRRALRCLSRVRLWGRDGMRWGGVSGACGWGGQGRHKECRSDELEGDMPLMRLGPDHQSASEYTSTST